MKRTTWIVLGWLVLSLTAHAASFDCARAQSKVEHLICDNSIISKLDEDLNAAYKAALQDEKQADTVKRAQKQWMKGRNSCVDVTSLASSYRSRIYALNTAIRYEEKLKESYRLVMSKDDVMCNHMRQLMNDDMERLSKGKYGRTFDRHDAFVESLQEFNSIPWKTIRVTSESSGEAHYRDVESAVFDLNNDGVMDFVIRYKGYLSGIRVDTIYMLDSQAGNRTGGLSTKDLFNSSNQIDLVTTSYRLSNPLDWDTSRIQLISPFAYNNVSLRLLSPFIYRGTSYLYMQSLYRNNEAIGGDYVVIAKYVGGIISGADMSGKMEDICYVKRFDVKQPN